MCFTKLYCRYRCGCSDISGCRVFVLQSVSFFTFQLRGRKDTVFSGHYSGERNPKSTQEIRDFIISTREVATTKAVKSARDWFIAWNQAAATITSHSHTKATNVSNTGSASSVSSLLDAKSTTTSLSVTTEPCASGSRYDGTSCSQNWPHLRT